MIIGGEDFLFHLPSEIPAAEVVLDRLRRLWPDSMVRDPEAEALHPIQSPWVAIHGVRCRELLIYRDQAGAESWDRDGMTPENTNSMICLIVGEPSPVESGEREVTLVSGERTGAIEQLIRDLEADFQAARQQTWNHPRAL